MKDFYALNAWAIHALHKFGFNSALKTVSVNDIVNKPLSGQESERKDHWSGFYHIFEQSPCICLYMYDQLSKKAQVIMAESNQNLAAIMLTKEIKTEEEVLKQSRIAALSDEKMDLEKKKVLDFLDRQKTIGLIGTNIKKEENIIELLNENVSSISKKNENKVLTINEMVAIPLYFKKTNNLNNSFLQSYFEKNCVEVFEIMMDLRVKYHNTIIDLNKGQILARFQSKLPDSLVVIELNGSTMLDCKLYSSRYQAVNSYTIGDGPIEEQKWVFVATDLGSALLINDYTGVNVIVCENVNNINDLFADIRKSNKDVKIGYFTNERFIPNESSKFIENDKFGVFIFQIEAKLVDKATWFNFIYESYSNGGSVLKKMIKEQVKIQHDRVVKLQVEFAKHSNMQLVNTV